MEEPDRAATEFIVEEDRVRTNALEIAEPGLVVVCMQDTERDGIVDCKRPEGRGVRASASARKPP